MKSEEKDATRARVTHDLGSSLAISIVLGAKQLLLLLELAGHGVEAVGEKFHAVEANKRVVQEINSRLRERGNEERSTHVHW